MKVLLSMAVTVASAHDAVFDFFQDNVKFKS